MLECSPFYFQVRELFFDISGLNSEKIRILEFIESLIQHQDPKKLLLPRYEPTIRYAQFPALDLRVEDRENFSYDNHFAVKHQEVFKVLSWLYKHKGVKSIIELKVQDRLVNPHSELKIARYVKRFNVEVLDWKILDLPIFIFDDDDDSGDDDDDDDDDKVTVKQRINADADDKAKVKVKQRINADADDKAKVKVKERIRELHLYSSGKRAVISHWLGSEGLRTLPNACPIPPYCQLLT
jgi:hypothetical protein